MMMRGLPIVQRPVEWIMIAVATIFASGISSVAIIGVMAWNIQRRWVENRNDRRLTRAQMDQAFAMAAGMPGQRENRTTTASEFLLGIEERNRLDQEHQQRRHHHAERTARMLFRTEAEMTREAIRRSLLEQ
jgi:ABC-type nickel/cobalt efflux system permease component RcnA